MNDTGRQHLYTTLLAALAVGVLGVVVGCGGEMTESASAPGAGPGSQEPACQKDADCKGSRVCERGACVSPR